MFGRCFVVKKKSKFTQLATGVALISTVGNLGTSALITETKKDNEVPEVKVANNSKNSKLTSSSNKLDDLLRPGYRAIIVKMRDFYGNYIGEQVIHVSGNTGDAEEKNDSKLQDDIETDISKKETEVTEKSSTLSEESVDSKTDENIEKIKNSKSTSEAEENKGAISKDLIKQNFNEIAKGALDDEKLTEQKNDNEVQDYTKTDLRKKEVEETKKTNTLPEELVDPETGEGVEKIKNSQSINEAEENKGAISENFIKLNFNEKSKGASEDKGLTEEKLTGEESSTNLKKPDLKRQMMSLISSLTIKYVKAGGMKGIAGEIVARFTGGGKTTSEQIGGFVGTMIGSCYIPSMLCSALAMGSATAFGIPTLVSFGAYALLSKFAVIEKVTHLGKAVGGFIGKGLSTMGGFIGKGLSTMGSFIGKGFGRLFKSKSQSESEIKNKDKNAESRTTVEEELPDMAKINDIMGILANNGDNKEKLEDLLTAENMEEMNKILKIYGGGTLENMSIGDQLDFSKLVKPFEEGSGGEPIRELRGSREEGHQGVHSRGEQKGKPKKESKRRQNSTPNKGEKTTPPKKTWTQRICGFCLPALFYGALTFGFSKGLGVPVLTSAVAAYGVLSALKFYAVLAAAAGVTAVVGTGLVAYGTYAGAKYVFSKVKGLFTKKNPEKVENNANKPQKPLLNQIP